MEETPPQPVTQEGGAFAFIGLLVIIVLIALGAYVAVEKRNTASYTPPAESEQSSVEATTTLETEVLP